jgi:hypothetical protein
MTTRIAPHNLHSPAPNAQPSARQRKQAQDEALRTFHGYVYEQLNTPRKEDILGRARQRITLWKKEQLCSDYYIRFWSSVVASGDSATFKAKVLDASQRRSTGMMQNTPFSFLMREQR